MASRGYRTDLLSPVDPRAQLKDSFGERNSIQPEEADELCCEACDPEDAEPDVALHFCYACDVVLCDICWKAQLPHRKNRQATSGVVHEKTDPWTAKKVQSALSPPADEKTYARLCMQDENTAWFGIERENRQGEPLIFHDTGRYAELMTSTKDERRRLSFHSDWSNGSSRDMRTPSLVSFVGQSGAGKSTLINLLIAFKGGPNKAKLPSPVVGMTGKDLPTSEDVHLYSDPSTCFGDNPMLYADCEGLDGGEREPVKSRIRRSKQPDNRKSQNPDAITKVRHNSERELQWADNAEKRSRQFAVAHLYPRLLFTFSDTIVFVLKNPRVIEGVFERLIDWASAALETSANQPVLPCAIIALNATEVNIDEELWDIEYATTQLLESLSATVQRNPSFQKYADFWNARNKQISTLEELILCYYSSIKIVRIPAAGRPKLIQEQVEKLYYAIDEGCKLTRERKRTLRMLLDSAELQSYLQCAFDHFAQTLDVAFDFVQASFINNPIPFDFGGNILRLALSIMERLTPQDGPPDPKAIFQELSSMVASCIMLDSVRKEIRGNAERIFPEYLSHLDTALEDFCDRHWPCEFVAFGAEYPTLMRHFDAITMNRNLKYITTQSRCINVRAGHSSKGHQTADGTIFHSGDYFAEFTWEAYHEEFHAAVYFRLEYLMGILDERTRDGTSPEVAAATIHREETLAPFYRKHLKSMAHSFQSHSVCLCCLFEQPEHVLPCSHIFCSSCVKSYGKIKSKTLIEIQDCPLEADMVGKYKPSTVYLKPEMAAHRVLVLDGGGVRAVVQLEILRLLEREWNGKLPIRCFFDLIVGTGSGSLIALGLGMRYWSLDQCTFYTERILNDAYARRTGRGIPGIGRLLETYSKSKFDSSSLESVLKEAFPEAQYLFGGKSLPGHPASAIKVAVTATSSTGSPVVFANYNRKSSEFLPYTFCRPDKLPQEMKVWQAARASMATPRLFKPFRHNSAKQIYTAAEIAFQNPINIADTERRLLAGHQETIELPDLVLSLGTGVDSQPRLQQQISSAASVRSIRTATPSVVGSLRSLGGSRDPLRRVASPTRCEMTSDQYSNNLPISQRNSRFIRFNPVSMMGIPAAEELSKMRHMQTLASSHIDMVQIREIAARLLATLFYFETMDDVVELTDGKFLAKGYILCRLPNQTKEIADLGKLIREKSSFTPQFIIREFGRVDTPKCVEISTKVTGEMILDMQFRLPPIDIVTSCKDSSVEISLHVDGDGGHPISGFPRSLTKIEKKVVRHRRALEAARPGTALGSIGSGGQSGSASMSIHSRSSKPWSPPDPGRHASVASAMSPTASTMSIPHTISTNQASERDTDYPQTPATTVTNSSFPIQGYRRGSQVVDNPDDKFDMDDGRGTPQQRDYQSAGETPHQHDYLPAKDSSQREYAQPPEILHQRVYAPPGALPQPELTLPQDTPQTRDETPPRQVPQPRDYASSRPPQLSLKLSQSNLLPNKSANNSTSSLDVVNIPAYDDVGSRVDTERLPQKGPYELEAPQGAKVLKSTYSPFPLRRRKSNKALDQFGPPLRTGSNPRQQPSPPQRLQVSNGNEIPRGDSPVLGMDSDSSPQDDSDQYRRPKSPPANRQLPRPPPVPRNRSTRDSADSEPTTYTSFRAQQQEPRVDPLFRTYLDPIRRNKESSVQPQQLLNPSYVARDDTTSGILDMYHESQMEVQRSNSGKTREIGIWTENHERLKDEEGMPLEMRLRKLEDLVGKLEQENAKIGGKGVPKKTRGIGLMK